MTNQTLELAAQPEVLEYFQIDLNTGKLSDVRIPREEDLDKHPEAKDFLRSLNGEAAEDDAVERLQAGEVLVDDGRAFVLDRIKALDLSKRVIRARRAVQAAIEGVQTVPEYEGPETLTKAQRAFIELDRQYREYLDFHRRWSEAQDAVVAESGLDHYFQDDQGIVYKTAKAKGHFVYYQDAEILRTRRLKDDEVKAPRPLSMVEARERTDFEVEGKRGE